MQAASGNGSGIGSGNGRDGSAFPASAPPREQAQAQQRIDAHADARAAAEKAARREGAELRERNEDAHGGAPPTARDPDAGLIEVARAILGAAQESASSAGATVGAFGTLVRADIALAKASLLSGTLLGLAAGVAGATTWALAVGLLVVGLVNAGLPLWGALALAALATLLVAAGCVLWARRRFAEADLAATRRQWRMLRHGRHDAGSDAGRSGPGRDGSGRGEPRRDDPAQAGREERA